jgi:hypothetical protein
VIRKLCTILGIIGLAIALVFAPQPGSDRIYAQFVGAAQVPGFASAASNAVIGTVIGNALAVTNPASNFIMLVQGGPVYCTSALAEIGQSTITLLANTTYMIVANCAQQTVYAKTAVTGPGTVVATGLPSQILAPISGVEVPIATVVCNATACGNGGNGTITDLRPLANFPGAGTPMNTVTFAALQTTNVTDGTIIYCTTCAVATSPCTGASTGAFALRVNGAWRCQ